MVLELMHQLILTNQDKVMSGSSISYLQSDKQMHLTFDLFTSINEILCYCYLCCLKQGCQDVFRNQFLIHLNSPKLILCLNSWKFTVNVRHSYISLRDSCLSHCGLVTPYGVRDLGQHWLR